MMTRKQRTIILLLALFLGCLSCASWYFSDDKGQLSIGLVLGVLGILISAFGLTKFKNGKN